MSRKIQGMLHRFISQSYPAHLHKLHIPSPSLANYYKEQDKAYASKLIFLQGNIILNRLCEGKHPKIIGKLDY